MKISNVKYFCTVNGEGVRTAVFVSGCNQHCKGCFNPISWDFNYGLDFDEKLKEKIFTSVEPEYINGISVLGGEPLDAKNQEGVLELLKDFRKKFGNSKTIWVWTGYVYGKNLPHTEFTDELLKLVDVLVDGPFVRELKDLTLKFRGSSNQRILHNVNGNLVEVD